ncbi:MAG: cbb3-type cytochrome c oxidase subunit 3 [Melioribacteraceae bacterium]|nr:cbb3-type cytochrome c oxidase subunit 3 [Melioribacteraceae bacterium]
MFSKYLTEIKDVSIFPILVLVVFFLMFISTIYWVIKLSKNYRNKMKNLPLEEDQDKLNNSENLNEDR